jgi:hypothetical protein
MAYTLSQLATIEEAIASGTLRVEIDNRVMVYQSLDALIALRDRMIAEIGVETPTTLKGRAVRLSTGHGL